MCLWCIGTGKLRGNKPLTIQERQCQTPTMTDDEFLNYCETHAGTPRCGFIPGQLARLCRLAGAVGATEFWAQQNLRIVNCDREAVRRLIELGRHHLAEAQARADA